MLLKAMHAERRNSALCQEAVENGHAKAGRNAMLPYVARQLQVCCQIAKPDKRVKATTHPVAEQVMEEHAGFLALLHMLQLLVKCQVFNCLAVWIARRVRLLERYIK